MEMNACRYSAVTLDVQYPVGTTPAVTQRVWDQGTHRVVSRSRVVASATLDALDRHHAGPTYHFDTAIGSVIHVTSQSLYIGRSWSWSRWRNDGVAAASSDGGPTGGRGPPTVLRFLVTNFSVCLVVLSSSEFLLISASYLLF